MIQKKKSTRRQRTSDAAEVTCSGVEEIRAKSAQDISCRHEAHTHPTMMVETSTVPISFSLFQTGNNIQYAYPNIESISLQSSKNI